jgi:hypothetical protein
MNFKALVLALSVASTSAFAPSANGRVTSSPLFLQEGQGPLGETPSKPGLTIEENLFALAPSTMIQGKTLKTWDIINETTERVQVSAKSGTRPLHANVEYWHTPSYIPMKLKCYSEDGALRPLNAVIETPKHPKTIAFFNINSVEFPITAAVADNKLTSSYDVLSKTGKGTHVQGGMVSSFPLSPTVEAVQVLIKTESRNMKVRIELLQGPNNIKQSYEIYASVGYKTPFYAVFETPGPGNVIRIHNENTIEFPVNAWVEPYRMGQATTGTTWNTM